MSALKQVIAELEEDRDDELLGWVLAHTEFPDEISHEEIISSFLEDQERGIYHFFGEEEIDIPVDLLPEE